jgi:hypothetical protein
MVELSRAQKAMLEKMRVYRVVAQFRGGAITVVCASEYQRAMIIDIDGQVYNWGRYLLALERRVAQLSAQ